MPSAATDEVGLKRRPQHNVLAGGDAARDPPGERRIGIVLALEPRRAEAGADFDPLDRVDRHHRTGQFRVQLRVDRRAPARAEHRSRRIGRPRQASFQRRAPPRSCRATSPRPRSRRLRSPAPRSPLPESPAEPPRPPRPAPPSPAPRPGRRRADRGSRISHHRRHRHGRREAAHRADSRSGRASTLSMIRLIGVPVVRP